MSQLTHEQAVAQAIGHHQAGRLKEAEALYREILCRDPQHADALQNYGVLAAQLNHVETGIQLLQKSLLVRPDHPDTLGNLARLMASTGRIDEGAYYLSRIASLRPGDVKSTHNLSTFLHSNGRFEQAISVYRQVIMMDPAHADAHSNLGLALGDMGQLDEAICTLKRAIAIKPEHGGAHANKALMHLLRGEMQTGFEEFEWRWKSDGFPQYPADQTPRYKKGMDVAGKTIYLLGEQGIGDMIQFVRYAALFKERGAKVIAAVLKEVVRVLSRADGVDMCVDRDGPLPTFDYHVPMMSLPLEFSTQPEEFPAPKSYLTPWPQDQAKWQQRVAELPGVKVGLVWAGNPKHRRDPVRSMEQSLLAPLAGVPNVTLISLQKLAPGKVAVPHVLPLIDWTTEFMDFGDTAGLIAHLDLVITVDTAIAHLAAAMGKPVWVMVSHIPDWRWLLDRSDSPWYPTMRLFRQPQAGEWLPVVNEVTAALQEFVTSHNRENH